MISEVSHLSSKLIDTCSWKVLQHPHQRGMAAACIVGHSHPHAIHSSHHHQILSALLPPNTQIPHLTAHNHSGGPSLGPHISILHEATRNHIQLALHGHSPISVPTGPPATQFTLPSPTAPQQPQPQQISLPPPPTQLSLSSPNQLTYPPPTASIPSAQTLPPLNVPPPAGASSSLPQRVPASSAAKVATTSSTPTSTSAAVSAASTPAPPTRPPTHEPSELRTL